MNLQLLADLVRVEQAMGISREKNLAKTRPNNIIYYILIFILLYSGIIVNASAFQQETSNLLDPASIVTTSVSEGSCSDHLQCKVWDPGIQCRMKYSVMYWLSSRQRNKITHIICGNGGQRGKGINCVYWNKGPSFLSNKQLDIETIIGTHKPHILGLGEANFRHDHDLLDDQQTGYKMHLDSCIDNPDLGSYIYTHISEGKEEI